jgi:hypothetical protein
MTWKNISSPQTLRVRWHVLSMLQNLWRLGDMSQADFCSRLRHCSCRWLQINGQCMASRTSSTVGWPGPAYGEPPRQPPLSLSCMTACARQECLCSTGGLAQQASGNKAPAVTADVSVPGRRTSSLAFSKLWVTAAFAVHADRGASTWCGHPCHVLSAEPAGGPCDQFGAYCRMWEVVDFAELEPGGCQHALPLQWTCDK